MNLKIVCLFILFLGTLPLVVFAQTNPRVEIPLAVGQKNLKISGLKDARIENIEGGGIRINFRNDSKTRIAGMITLEFDQPVKATTMGFEFSASHPERIAVTGAFKSGQKFKTLLDSMGSVLTPYMVDFAQLASEAKSELNESPLQSVVITFRVPPETGENSVELRKWWVE